MNVAFGMKACLSSVMCKFLSTVNDLNKYDQIIGSKTAFAAENLKMTGLKKLGKVARNQQEKHKSGHGIYTKYGVSIQVLKLAY